MKLRLRKLLSDQRGGASIYTSMIIMVILMLAVLSFATIMSRNYQQTTESQLNAQAFYAAETGIGDARAQLLQLLDAYGRGVRESLPASLTDVDDNDLNILLNGLPPTVTQIGRAVAIDDDDQLLFSTQVPSGDVYYVKVGILLICDDDQTPARSYTTYGSSSPITTQAKCLTAIREAHTSWNVNATTFQATPLICEDDQTPARSYTTYGSSSPITTQAECLTAIREAHTSWNVNATTFQAPSVGSVNRLLEPADTTADFGSVLVVRNNCLFVGDPGYNTSRGAVFTYQRVGSTWTKRGTYTRSSTSPDGRFGRFGHSLAVASNGSMVVIGSPGRTVSGKDNAGQAHVYDNNASCRLTFNADLVPYQNHDAGSKFGTAVAFNGVNRIAVGGPGMLSSKGAVAVYHVASPNTPSIPGQDFLVKGPSPGAQIGKSLALVNNRLAIGAPDIGRVFVHEYKSDGLLWEEKDKLGFGGDEFGASLALEGNFLAIGAPGYGGGRGAAYVYQYKDNTWDNKVDEREGNNAGDGFGRSLSMWSRYLAIGAPDATNKEDGLRFFRVKALGDLTMAELSALLEQTCVNKGDDGAEFYNFDLLEEEDGIHYSCLNINLAPQVLYYDEIEQNRSLNISLKGIDEVNDPITYEDLDRLIIRWVNVEDTAASFDTTSDYPNFPTYNDWNYSAPVLELQITPLNKTKGYDRQILNDLAKTIYIYPTNEVPNKDGNSGNVKISWKDLKNGDILKGHCGQYRKENPRNDRPNTLESKDICTMELKDLMRELPTKYPGFHPATSPDEVDFHLRIRSLYKPSHLELTGYSYQYSRPHRSTDWQRDLAPLDARRIRFREIQAVVGATGHAGNVQVRLEERFRLQPVYDYPEHGVQSSQTVCKILVSDQDTGTDVTGGALAPQNLPSGTDLNEECAAW